MVHVTLPISVYAATRFNNKAICKVTKRLEGYQVAKMTDCKINVISGLWDLDAVSSATVLDRLHPLVIFVASYCVVPYLGDIVIQCNRLLQCFHCWKKHEISNKSTDNTFHHTLTALVILFWLLGSILPSNISDLDSDATTTIDLLLLPLLMLVMLWSVPLNRRTNDPVASA